MKPFDTDKMPWLFTPHGDGELNEYFSTDHSKIIAETSKEVLASLSESRDKAVFEAVQNMTLDDVKAFQQKWIKNREYNYGFLGREDDFDSAFISTLGPVTHLTLEDIFGY